MLFGSGENGTLPYKKIRTAIFFQKAPYVYYGELFLSFS
jgi:hypothetical protein